MMSTWKPDPQQKKALSNGPRMFATLALAFIDKYGDDAKDLIYKTMYNYGHKRGQQMAEQAQDPTDLVEFERMQVEALQAKGYNTPDFDDPTRHFTVRQKRKCQFDLQAAGNCEVGIPEIWEDMGLDADTIKMLGELHCVPGDTGTRKGFNENIDFNFLKLAPRGDDYCEWCEELPEK